MDYVGNRVWFNHLGEIVVTLLFRERGAGAVLPLTKIYANAIEALADELVSKRLEPTQ